MNDSTELRTDSTAEGGAANGILSPSSADPDTRTRLLAEARVQFARHGYKAASVRAITAGADANLGAITYHFGSKQALFGEVLAGVVRPLMDRFADAANTEGAALDRIEAVIRGFFDHFEANPDQPRLMLPDISVGKPPPPPVLEALREGLGQVSSIVREGQKDGTIAPGDPLMLTLSVIAQPVYLHIVRPVIGEVAGRDPVGPGQRSATIDHVVAFVRRGLTAPESP